MLLWTFMYYCRILGWVLMVRFPNSPTTNERSGLHSTTKMLELYRVIHFSQNGNPFLFLSLLKFEGGWKGYFSPDCRVIFLLFKLPTCLHLFLRPDKSHPFLDEKGSPTLVFSYLNYHLILPNSFWRVMVANTPSSLTYWYSTFDCADGWGGKSCVTVRC
jgi:hypothetical protein